MIASLRQRQRLAWGLLTPLVALGIAVGLASREPIPATDYLPNQAAGTGPGADGRLVEWQGAELTSHVVTSDAGVTLWLDPVEELRLPDVLVYWSPEPAAPGTALQAGVVLLGSVAGPEAQSYALPAAARGGGFVLYSLAHQELFASASAPTPSSAGR